MTDHAGLAALRALPEALCANFSTALRLEPVPVGPARNPLAWRFVLRKAPDACIYVHRWMRSDPDHLHDHPWPFTSIVLAGGYWEVTPSGRKWREPGSVGHLDETELHRVEIDQPGEVWSMIITGPKIKSWGFLVDGWMVPWREYRGAAEAAAIDAARGVHA